MVQNVLNQRFSTTMPCVFLRLLAVPIASRTSSSSLPYESVCKTCKVLECFIVEECFAEKHKE